ncbi:formylglycine-generating enzyme family protein [Phenylobacterium sp.]|uniref:formylglycine-generating enzyme family protein n=1 Tax=Phenylobacterium sp. TaxID=1871053 RepID=UPI00286EA95A|nr:formylglycine-generating enzyme family protein [Phenylobacterium sp.]
MRETRPALPIAAGARRPGMTWIPGGAFRMGSDHHYAEEAPARDARVDGFWIDTAPVTNRQFARFVRETGWTTFAEIAPNPADYPGAPRESLVAGSLVFTPPAGPVPLDNPGGWWRYAAGADWRHPLGPESGLAGLWEHPVVHVAWSDVEAYAVWAGADLPTEAEWEFAARGGLTDTEFAWGDELSPKGWLMANTWQGGFPHQSLKPNGRFRTSKVGSFPANGYGLSDMIGNVWEWTRDGWSAPSPTASPCCGDSFDPDAPTIARKVLKGGSHLCAPTYCRRYRPAARHAQSIDSCTSHIGFRCAIRP